MVTEAFKRIWPSLLVVSFACGIWESAQAESEWGIDVSVDEENAVCELRKPFRISPTGDELGDIWVGFYWLRNASTVSGHTLPNNQIVLIIKSEQDFDGEDSYTEPLTAHFESMQLEKYKLDSVVQHAYFFASGDGAQRIFNLARSGTPFQIGFGLPDTSLRTLTVNTSSDDRFKIYAEMFLTCGIALRS